MMESELAAAVAAVVVGEAEERGSSYEAAVVEELEMLIGIVVAVGE